MKIKALLFLTLLSSQLFGQVPDKDRFAGLHFDFHAGLGDKHIGETFTFEMIDSMLTIIKPDFIQVDCKGHAGITSYPTKVGNTPESFDKDIMKIWRAVTNKHGVPLFVHYSGLWDSRALELHPDWGRINADNSVDKRVVAMDGPYLDQLMIPQLVELATSYNLDGAWIDGDCWMLGNDFTPSNIARFAAETGINTVPRKSEDPQYFEWMEFNRKQFRNYITRYIDAAHAAQKNFKITSNWSFSSMMPEKVDIPVDFLSGDVAGSNSLYSSAFESRCLALQGKPWDLMSWSFSWKNDIKATKSVVQLQQEAAEVLAMGGGFQSYWQQNRDGTPEVYQFDKMKELIAFTKERKKYCYEAQVIPQIGLLYSTYAWKRIPSGGLYNSHGLEGLKNNLNILLDAQLPVEILMDHHLAGGLDKYPVLVLPEWKALNPAIISDLLNYVKQGGNLIIVGAEATQDWQKYLGIEVVGDIHRNAKFKIGFEQKIIGINADFFPIKAQKDTEVVGWHYTADDLRFKGDFPVATIHQLGKGKIAGVYLNTSSSYANYQSRFLPDLMHTIVDKMKPDLISKVSGSRNIHQVVTEKNGKRYIHLINTTGPHDNPNAAVYDEVVPLQDIVVSYKTSKKPQKVLLQPGNQKVAYQYKNEILQLKLPQVDLYTIIEIE